MNPKRGHALHLHSLLTIDSLMRMEKKNYPQVYLGKCKYRTKNTKMTKFIEAELESE